MTEATSDISTKLPIELWAQIFDEVARLDEEAVEWQEASTDYFSLKSLAQCCHFLYDLAAPLIHHTITIGRSDGYGQDLVKLLADTNNCVVTRCVKTIVVLESNGYDDSFEDQPVMLLGHLKGKADLREVRLGVQDLRMDGRFLEFLHSSWPSCRLYIWVNAWPLAPELKSGDALHRIYSSPCLVSLDFSWISTCDAVLNNDDSEDTEDEHEGDISKDLIQVKSFIDSCGDRLEILKLTLNATTSRSKYVNTFTLDSNDKLPSLTMLELHSVYLAPGQSLLWAQCANWIRLSHLVVDIDAPQDFIRHFTGRVPHLSLFEIKVKSPIDEKTIASPIDAFLQSINRLRHFVSYNVPKAVLPMLAARHGDSLQTLHFRVLVPTSNRYGKIEDDNTAPFPRRYDKNSIPEEQAPTSEYPYSPPNEFLFYLGERKCYASSEMDRHLHHDDMEYIQQSFPHIHSFKFDLDPRGCLTSDLLTPFSRHRNLQHLEIHLPINIQYIVPDAKFESDIENAIRRAFEYIDRQTEDPTAASLRESQLKSLALASDNWDRHDAPYLSNSVFFRRIYKCRRLNGQPGQVIHHPAGGFYEGRWFFFNSSK